MLNFSLLARTAMTNYLFSGKRLKEYKLRTMRKNNFGEKCMREGLFEGIVIDQKANEKVQVCLMLLRTSSVYLSIVYRKCFRSVVSCTNRFIVIPIVVALLDAP